MSRNRNYPNGFVLPNSRADSTRTLWAMPMRMDPGLRTVPNQRSLLVRAAKSNGILCIQRLQCELHSPSERRHHHGRPVRPAHSETTGLDGVVRLSGVLQWHIGCHRCVFPARKRHRIHDQRRAGRGQRLLEIVCPLGHHCRNMRIYVCEIKILITV